MDKKEYHKFYLIREDVLPESVIKTLKIKDALKENSKLSIYDAVQRFDLSRSAFINTEIPFFLLMKMLEHREFTLILYVNDVVGTLATVLHTILNYSYLF